MDNWQIAMDAWKALEAEFEMEPSESRRAISDYIISSRCGWEEGHGISSSDVNHTAFGLWQSGRLREVLADHLAYG